MTCCLYAHLKGSNSFISMITQKESPPIQELSYFL